MRYNIQWWSSYYGYWQDGSDSFNSEQEAIDFAVLINSAIKQSGWEPVDFRIVEIQDGSVNNFYEGFKND